MTMTGGYVWQFFTAWCWQWKIKKKKKRHEVSGHPQLSNRIWRVCSWLWNINCTRVLSRIKLCSSGVRAKSDRACKRVNETQYIPPPHFPLLVFVSWLFIFCKWWTSAARQSEEKVLEFNKWGGGSQWQLPIYSETLAWWYTRLLHLLFLPPLHYELQSSSSWLVCWRCRVASAWGPEGGTQAGPWRRLCRRTWLSS